MIARNKTLKYVSIHPASEGGTVSWQGSGYTIAFSRLAEDEPRAMPTTREPLGFRVLTISAVERPAAPVPANLLNWIGVHVGEDPFPERQVGPARPDLRGTLMVSVSDMQRFLDKAASWERQAPSDPWRSACLEAALGYFFGGIAMGLELMPATVGTFAVGLETLSNAAFFQPEVRRKFGRKLGPEAMTDLVVDGVRRDRLAKDLDLLKAIRDLYGAHFGLHQARERERLATLLRQWMARQGSSPSFAEASFGADTILNDIQRSASPLYVTALDTSRALLAAMIDASDMVAVASVGPKS